MMRRRISGGSVANAMVVKTTVSTSRLTALDVLTYCQMGHRRVTVWVSRSVVLEHARATRPATAIRPIPPPKSAP